MKPDELKAARHALAQNIEAGNADVIKGLLNAGAKEATQ